jgi:hypothetical protein
LAIAAGGGSPRVAVERAVVADLPCHQGVDDAIATIEVGTTSLGEAAHAFVAVRQRAAVSLESRIRQVEDGVETCGAALVVAAIAGARVSVFEGRQGTGLAPKTDTLLVAVAVGQVLTFIGILARYASYAAPRRVAILAGRTKRVLDINDALTAIWKIHTAATHALEVRSAGRLAGGTETVDTLLFPVAIRAVVAFDLRPAHTGEHDGSVRLTVGAKGGPGRPHRQNGAVFGTRCCPEHTLTGATVGNRDHQRKT